ncbi:restriction endonuclease subunit S [Methylobacter tundripaludum]|uniref:Restriction modification system protein containing a DNA specificity domain n=1 Tax=Methylobacter tundripaludum (strain ATCC BAA-1195 / DSM 17260 / SV96) TaxID=697282 RepID=G3ITF8_METTV|nr:restriction endonuclease subunit S [Methylobacter tundripaludum]EGW21368.1 restriction modification system protein containing a DNA specificity domain [Methylobacter tundripaludum SV96]
MELREARAGYLVEVEQRIPKGYKQTEVGVIPEDWEVKTVGSVAAYANGKAHEGSISDFGKYIVVNSKFISTNGKVKKYSDDCFSPTSESEILMVMSDVPNGRAIARCFFVDHNDLYTVNQRICVLRPNQINGRLFYYKLNRHPFYLSFDDGVKQTNLRKNDVLSCPLTIPPTKAEQEAIAEALSDADVFIESLEQLIAKKRHIKQGAMQERLTGKKRLPGFSGEWGVKRIGDVLTIAHGKSQHAVEDRNGIYPILATGGQIGVANCFLYDKPSVLIGRKGTIDRPQYMEQPFWTVDTLFYSVIHKQNNAKFLFYRFCLIDWKQYNEASGVPSLNARTIESIEIKVPFEDEQVAIAAILSDMDAEISALEDKLAKTRAIKQGMMRNLLTGRIRLL